MLTEKDSSLFCTSIFSYPCKNFFGLPSRRRRNVERAIQNLSLSNRSHNFVVYCVSPTSRIRGMIQRLQQRYNYVTHVSRAARRIQSARSASIIVVVAVGCASLAACNLIAVDDAERHPTDVFDRIRSVDLLPRSVNPQEPNANAPDRRQAAIYTDESVRALPLPTRAGKRNLSAVALTATSSISRIRRLPRSPRSCSAIFSVSGTQSIHASRARSPLRLDDLFRRPTSCSCSKTHCA